MISICEFHAGNARNVIPQTAELHGTVRTLTPEVRELVEKRVREVCEGVAKMTGAKVDLVYKRGYPVTRNHADQTDFATQVAKEVAGAQNVHDMPPLMGAEDFAYMLEARPGAFIFCGNGDTSRCSSSRPATSRAAPARPMKLVSAAGKPCTAPAAAAATDTPTHIP